MSIFTYSMPTRLVGGSGSLDRLPEEVGKFSRTCLIVCGRRAARLSGLLVKIQELLKSAKIEAAIFDQVEPNPTVDTVNHGATMARREKVRWMLAVGGGSSMDAAKAIALMIVNQGDVRTFFKGLRPENLPLPVVAVPTTSGTGSEVTPYATITDVGAEDKAVLDMPELFPRLAILDPALTATMPEAVTVNTGLNALCHAIEALLAANRSLFTDNLAREAIARIAKALPTARKSPQNLEARWEMQFSATMAGWAIANTGALVPHALGYPVTVRYDLPHGRATTLLMPAFLDRIKATEPERVGFVGETLGKKDDAAGALRELVESLGVAPRLSAYGVSEQDIDAFVALTKNKRQLSASPGFRDEAVLREMYLRSL